MGTKIFCKEENELKEISKILLNNIQNQKVVLSKSMIQEMTSCIYIAKVRYEENYKITVSKNEVVHRIYKPCIEVATNIVEELNEKFHIHLLDSEIYYIAINIAARSDYNVLEGELESGVINQARKQATQMLDCVYDMMHLDMRQNLSLLYDLISFLIPMDIRMRYGIIAKNPFAEATKKKYFSHTM